MNVTPFRQPLTAEVPIVGQPCDVTAWFVTVVLTCRCGAHEAVLITGRLGATGQCPACRKVFVVQGMTSTPGSPQVQFSIGIALPSVDGEKA